MSNPRFTYNDEEVTDFDKWHPELPYVPEGWEIAIWQQNSPSDQLISVQVLKIDGEKATVEMELANLAFGEKKGEYSMEALYRLAYEYILNSEPDYQDKVVERDEFDEIRAALADPNHVWKI